MEESRLISGYLHFTRRFWVESISDEFIDKLFTENIDIYLQRSEVGKKKYQEFINKNPEKPMNTSTTRDDSMVFSVL
jgi:hypothetical protein